MKINPNFVSFLTKGDVLDTVEVANIMGLSPEDVLDIDKQRVAALGLAHALERALHKMGRLWTLQAKNGTVRVLTDPEAVVYRKRQNGAGVRKIRRSVKGLQGVDTHLLNHIDRSDHANALGRASAQAAALDSINRKRDASTMASPAPAADPSRPRPKPAPVNPFPVPPFNIPGASSPAAI